MNTVTSPKLTYTHSAPLESAAQWLGTPEPGFRLFGFTKAQFSMLDVVLATAPCVELVTQ